MRLPDERAVPEITTEQMVEVDRAMVEDFGIDLARMMENAGRALAGLAVRRFLDGSPAGKRVVIMAGPGGNGGGGLVCARRLHGWGAEVRVLLAGPTASMSGVPLEQVDILRRMGVPIQETGESPDGALSSAEADLIVDALIGYSLRGAPRGHAAVLIEAVNRAQTPVLSLDVPSGLDATTGAFLDAAVRADATLTLALPKTGLSTAAAKPLVGELYLADIGVPADLYGRPPLNLTVGPIFAGDDVIRLR